METQSKPAFDATPTRTIPRTPVPLGPWSARTTLSSRRRTSPSGWTRGIFWI